MPVEKLTEAQAEAIRRDGVCRDTGITAHWGYHPKADARVFYLKNGEALPKGWSADPQNLVVQADESSLPKSQRLR
jgi:hypothetical protein